jgi:uncharacterized lipoprotein
MNEEGQNNQKTLEVDQNDPAVVCFKQLRKECIEDAQRVHLTPQILVTRIRDYNRKWNDLATQFPEMGMKIDGFKIVMQSDLIGIDSDLPQEFKDALRFL